MERPGQSLEMKLIEMSHAPEGSAVQCDGGGCPAVYETNRGSYVIIGRRMSADEKQGLPMSGIEDALEVPKELLQASAPKLI